VLHATVERFLCRGTYVSLNSELQLFISINITKCMDMQAAAFDAAPADEKSA